MRALRELFGVNDTDRYFAYVRFSMHGALIAIAVLCFQPTLKWPSTPYSFAIIVFALANGLLASWVIERTPAFSSAPKTIDSSFLMPIGINILSWALTIGILAMQGSSQIEPAEGGLALFLLSCFAFVLTIHIKNPYIITLAMGAITSVVAEHPTLDHPIHILIFSLLLVLGSRATVWSMKVVKELDRTRGLQAQLRVHEERMRFSQELHDSLGQHLAAMSLKTQLAASLYEKNADGVKGELHELEKLVRNMREDLHHVVAGYRNLYPSRELDTAKILLSDAGISVAVMGDPRSIPEKCEQLSSWFIREAATNVVKHAQAANVEFQFHEYGISVTNDGVHNKIESLGGMQALQDRVQSINGSISLSNHQGYFTAALTWKVEKLD